MSAEKVTPPYPTRPGDTPGVARAATIISAAAPAERHFKDL